MSIDYRDAVLPPDLAEKTVRLTAELTAQPGLCDQFPVSAYAEALVAGRGGYKFVPVEFRRWSRTIELEFNRDTLERYHQLLLLELIARFPRIVERRTYQYPESVLPNFRKFFCSIARRIDHPLQGHFVFGKSDFDKDLGVSAQHLIPCGAQLVDRASGIPRSRFLKGGLTLGWSLGRFMVSKIGGLAPLFQMHMDVRLLLMEFNPAGWKACYLRIAELLKLDRGIRGVCGASWWFDPQLAEISPRIAFLHDLPAQHGAGVFCLGADDASTRDALSNSPERQRLYDEGRYHPKTFSIVWGRDDLLAWAADESRE